MDDTFSGRAMPSIVLGSSPDYQVVDYVTLFTGRTTMLLFEVSI